MEFLRELVRFVFSIWPLIIIWIVFRSLNSNKTLSTSAAVTRTGIFMFAAGLLAAGMLWWWFDQVIPKIEQKAPTVAAKSQTGENVWNGITNPDTLPGMSWVAATETDENQYIPNPTATAEPNYENNETNPPNGVESQPNPIASAPDPELFQTDPYLAICVLGYLDNQDLGLQTSISMTLFPYDSKWYLTSPNFGGRWLTTAKSEEWTICSKDWGDDDFGCYKINGVPARAMGGQTGSGKPYTVVLTGKGKIPKECWSSNPTLAP